MFVSTETSNINRGPVSDDLVIISSSELAGHCIRVMEDLAGHCISAARAGKTDGILNPLAAYIGETVSGACATCVGVGGEKDADPVCVGHARFNLQTEEEAAAWGHEVRIPSNCPIILKDVAKTSCILAGVLIDQINSSGGEGIDLPDLIEERAMLFAESSAADGFERQQRLISDAASEFYATKDEAMKALGLNT
jgi:hypothetical protein